MADVERRKNDIDLITKIDSLLEYNKRQDERIGQIHKIILGNGNPENGLAIRFARADERTMANCNKIKSLDLKFWALIFVLVSAALTYGLSFIF